MMKIFILIVALLFVSCNLTSSIGSRSNEDIKLDLSDTALLIPVIEAGLQVVDEDKVLLVSRAISPNGVNTGAIFNSDETYIIDDSTSDSKLMAEYFGENWHDSLYGDDPHSYDAVPRTPDEVYKAKSDEISGGILRIPNNGYIKGIYGNNNNDFYITMEFISGKKYRIKQYIYPRDNFNIYYYYEEYLVNEEDVTTGSWAWSWFNNRNIYQKLSKEITYYRDGTYSKRSSESEKVLYNEPKSGAPTMSYTVEDLIENHTNYDYPSSIPIITTSAGSFSSATDSTVKGTRLSQDVTEYYTEDGETSYSVLYMEGIKRRDLRKNVTRYITDRSTGKTNTLSLNTNGNYYTEVNRVYKTKTTYNSEVHIWFKPVSSELDIKRAISWNNDLKQDSSDNSLYSGTLKIHWGSYGSEYQYIVNSSTGLVSISWISNITRSTLVSETIDLSDLENINISGGDSSWSFKGRYQLGELYGVYTYEDNNYNVVLDLEGIEIEDKFYKWK